MDMREGGICLRKKCVIREIENIHVPIQYT